jgi:hypothetical protein
MDDQLLAERLAAVGEDPLPRPDLGDRIRAAVARRRRQRQARAAVALCVVAALAVGGVVALARDPGDAARPGPNGDRAATEGPTATPSTLSALFPGRTPVRVDRRLASGKPFRAFMLAPNGTLVGAEQTYDENWNDRWGRSLIFDPVRRTEAVLPLTEITGYASDGRTIAWLQHIDPRHKFDLFCRDGTIGLPFQASDGSVWEDSIQVEAGRLAWSYYEDISPRRPAGQVVLAERCGVAPRVLPVRGRVMALRWPYVYVGQYDTGRLLRHDARTGRTTTVEIGRVARPPGWWTVAANRSTVLWTDRDGTAAPAQLRAVDLATGRSTLVDPDPPEIPGLNGALTVLTAGDRLLAYSSTPSDGPPSNSRGVVYDPETNSAVPMPGETFVAGHWLVWLDADAYWLLDVS